MDRDRSVDIDTDIDFKLAELIYKNSNLTTPDGGQTGMATYC